jgi:hypothetical protein
MIPELIAAPMTIRINPVAILPDKPNRLSKSETHGCVSKTAKIPESASPLVKMGMLDKSTSTS